MIMTHSTLDSMILYLRMNNSERKYNHLNFLEKPIINPLKRRDLSRESKN